MSSSAPFGRGGLEAGLAATARAVALAGGLVLVALMALTVLSIVLREVTGRPIPGDFELVEMGVAIAAFAFLPYCQLVGGNVIVDFVTARVPRRWRDGLDAAARLAYVAFAALLTWRLALGGLDMRSYGEVSMVLRVPVWWAFVPITLCCVLLTAICALTAWQSMRPSPA